MEAAPTSWRACRSLCRQRQRKLAADVPIRGRGRGPRRLSGLPLGGLMRMHNPPHPGRVLREYLGDMAVSAAAAHLRVTRVTLSRVLNSKSGISASMALRLAAALGTTPELWMNMQSQYDLWQAKRRKQPAVPPIGLSSRATV